MLRIAIIDDKYEEVKKGCAAVIAAGHRPAPIIAGHGTPFEKLVRTMEEGEIDGIVTDLHFNPITGDDRLYRPTYRMYEDAKEQPPAGMLIAVWAASKGIPVMINTSVGHHSRESAWILDGAMYGDTLRGVLGINDAQGANDGLKDWAVPVRWLVKMIEERRTLR